jgi:hypothetical protein
MNDFTAHMYRWFGCSNNRVEHVTDLIMRSEHMDFILRCSSITGFTARIQIQLRGQTPSISVQKTPKKHQNPILMAKDEYNAYRLWCSHNQVMLIAISCCITSVHLHQENKRLQSMVEWTSAVILYRTKESTQSYIPAEHIYVYHALFQSGRIL